MAVSPSAVSSMKRGARRLIFEHNPKPQSVLGRKGNINE
jgi:hypothetical protein